MKSLRNILEGSLLDNIDDVLADSDVKVSQTLIQKFLEKKL